MCKEFVLKNIKYVSTPEEKCTENVKIQLKNIKLINVWHVTKEHKVENLQKINKSTPKLIQSWKKM